MQVRKFRTFQLLGCALLLTAWALPAFAATGAEYGQHIKEHALTGHFSGEENPGNHQGFAGFEEHHHDHK